MTFEEYREENYPQGCNVLSLHGIGVNIEQQLKHAFDTATKENAIQWHNLRKNPNDLPKVTKEYITNIGVMTFDRMKDRHLWTTPLCDACDYYEEVTDEVIAWCECPQFKED